MANTFRTTLLSGKETHNIELEQIAAYKIEGKHLIGKGYGVDIGHVLLMGARHSPDIPYAKWYHIPSGEDDQLKELRKDQPASICVELYGDVRN